VRFNTNKKRFGVDKDQKKVITQIFETATGAPQTNYRWSLGENTGGYSLASGTTALTRGARCHLMQPRWKI
jgi:hypothetical protein